MSKDVKIALVTTVYNNNDGLSKLLSSLSSQTIKMYTHYILDDGSRIGCEKLVDDYSIQMKKHNVNVIFVKFKNNVGVNKGHEILFSLIKEKYFCWIDSDDWVEPTFVEVILKNIRRHKRIDVFHVNSWHYDGCGVKKKKTSLQYLSRNVIRSKNQYPAFCLSGQRFWDNFVVRTSSVKSFNPKLVFYEDINRREQLWYDAQLLFGLCVKNALFSVIKEPLSNICERANSVSRNVKFNSFDVMDFNKKIVDKMLEELSFTDQERCFFYRTREKCIHYYNACDLYRSGLKNQSRQEYSIYKKYVKSNNLPSNFINLTQLLPYMFIYDRFKWIFVCKRKVTNFLGRIFRRGKR